MSATPNSSAFPTETAEESVDVLKNTLPALPGYSFEVLKGRRSFRKRHCFDYVNGVPQATEVRSRPPEVIQGLLRTNTVAMQQAHPTWQGLDKKVLRFFGYYQEGVHECPKENARIHRVVLQFFLEDDTLLMSEPHQENSGLAQGTILKRHRVPKSLDGEQYYTLDDLDIGVDLPIYGKVVHLVDCDAFTRHFYHELGRGVRPVEGYPDDPFVTQRMQSLSRSAARKALDPDHQEMKRFHEMSAGCSNKTLQPTAAEREAAQDFFKYDRQVLRFQAVWDDRGTMHGEYRLFTLLFFLADKTLKVIEVQRQNSGHDPFPVFIKRQRVPKTRTPQADSNLETMSTRPQEYITETDLAIGRTVSLMGREMLIYNCDGFTQKYYRSKYGMSDFSPLDVTLPAKRVSRRGPPPHMGFGSEEDSLASWNSLVLKPPKDRPPHLGNRVLRFGGYLENQPCRRMLLVYFLSDDTVGIYEQAGKNCGTVAGKFLQPQRVKKPIPGNATLTQSAPYYEASDFFVGAKVNINGHILVLDMTDEQTVRLLEGVPKESSIPEVNTVLKRLREYVAVRFTRATDAFRALDRNHDGVICLSELGAVCKELDFPMTPGELAALISYLDVNGDGVIDYNEFVGKIHPQAYVSELEVDPTGTVTASERTTSPVFQQRVDSAALTAEDERVLRLFREKLLVQHSVLLDTFRMLSQRSSDARIGVKEFTETVQTTLAMQVTPVQLRSLIRQFFPSPQSRLNFKEFVKVLDGAPHFLRK